MSKSFIIACLLGCAVMASAPAFSADLPNWAGVYVGISAGYGSGKSASDIKDIDDTFVAFFQQQGVMPTTLRSSLHGFIGGGTVGYNWQFDRWVAGVEADLSHSSIKGDVTEFRQQVGASPEGFTSHGTEIAWFGTARARIGYLATPDVLLFATGGLAYGNVKSSSGYRPEPTTPCHLNAICSTGDASENKFGWTVGGGVETKIATKWTAKIEYLHFNLGSTYDVAHSHSINPFFANTPVIGVTSAISGDIVRVGLNYQL